MTETQTTACLQKPPSCDLLPLDSEDWSAVVEVKNPPDRAILKTVSNQAVRAVLPANFRDLVSDQWLKDRGRFVTGGVDPLAKFDDPDNISFAFAQYQTATTETERIKNPGYWGRSLPLSFGQVPINFPEKYGLKMVAGTYSQKGGSCSGYKTNMTKSLPDRPHQGFLSEPGAREEMELLTDMAQQGFRCALILGYVLYDKQQIGEWLAEEWQYQGREIAIAKAKFIEAELAKVQGKTIAVLHRLVGVTERIYPMTHMYRPLADDYAVRDKGGLIRRAEMSRAARLWLAELTFSDNLIPPKMERQKIIGVLEKIARPKIDRDDADPIKAGRAWIVLGQEERNIYFTFMQYIVDRNSEALARIVEKKPELAGTNLGMVAAQTKDIDLAWVLNEANEEIKAKQEKISLSPIIADSSTMTCESYEYNESASSVIDALQRQRDYPILLH